MRVLEVDYHRNGVGGRPFIVAIVEDPIDTMPGRFLYVDFGEHDYAVAVLDLDKTAEGNIHMHSTGSALHPGGNAWRGDMVKDMIGIAVREALEARRPHFS